MPVDAVGGIMLIGAAVIAQVAGSAGPNRISVLSVILGALGGYLVYNGYRGGLSVLQPWLPYFM